MCTCLRSYDCKLYLGELAVRNDGASCLARKHGSEARARARGNRGRGEAISRAEDGQEELEEKRRDQCKQAMAHQEEAAAESRCGAAQLKFEPGVIDREWPGVAGSGRE